MTKIWKSVKAVSLRKYWKILEDSMKKGDQFEGIIERVDFPNKGLVSADGERIVVKNTIPGQTIRGVLTKKRKGKCEGRLLEVVKPAPNECPEKACVHFGTCGGCQIGRAHV